jgi:hypothetical protein
VQRESEGDSAIGVAYTGTFGQTATFTREEGGNPNVPIPKLLPPMVGRARDHAAQAALQILLLTELRKNASELMKSGAVRIPVQRWQELAERAGVPKHLLPELLRRWERDEPARCRRQLTGKGHPVKGVCGAK